MNLTGIMLFGNAINGGGSSNVKRVVFNLTDIDKYETVYLFGELPLYKLSDEVPTYEEVLNGSYAACQSYVDNNDHTNDHLTCYHSASDTMGDTVKFDEDMNMIVFDEGMTVLSSKTIELMGADIPPGLYMPTTFQASDGIEVKTHFAMLEWAR